MANPLEQVFIDLDNERASEISSQEPIRKGNPKSFISESITKKRQEVAAEDYNSDQRTIEDIYFRDNNEGQ
jgi:hypothetical protein